MLSRLSPAVLTIAGSILALAGLTGALYWISDTGYPGATNQPLIVHCAEAMRLPMNAIAEEYEKEYGQKVELRYNPSQALLVNLQLTGKGDLFLPADDSYIKIAVEKGLVNPGDVLSLARMHAVVVVNPKFGKTIASWNDFIAPGHKIGLANVEISAISKLLKRELQAQGKWDALVKRSPNYLGNVNEVFNSVHKPGTSDVGIVWDTTASPHPGTIVVKLKELEKVQAHVQIALTKTCTQRDQALHFICYIRAKDKGAKHLKQNGFSDIEERGAMNPREELLVHAGAMLRPALEDAITEFEKRENVRIKRIYNGCGILVSQMKTGDTPDVYFACDTRFMNDVGEKFGKPTTISTNQLVIAVQRGNPKEIKDLVDLAKPDLKIGVGHEINCALGAITADTLRFAGRSLYEKVRKNVKVESPTGDALVNQLRTGSLDVVLAYRSNVQPFLNELEAIDIKDIKCSTATQPIAISKNSTHPDISKRLMEYLKTPESRTRFESLGFGWEVKEK